VRKYGKKNLCQVASKVSRFRGVSKKDPRKQAKIVRPQKVSFSMGDNMQQNKSVSLETKVSTTIIFLKLFIK